MANFTDLDIEGTVEGLILVPSENALVQDLGPFLSGRMMLTDILAGSALVCHADGGQPRLDADGMIHFAFEGNMNGAVNLERYHEKCSCAAGRLAHRHPSIAYGRARPEDLQAVAGYDLERFVFTEIFDRPALEAWAAESIDGFMPSRTSTPCSDMKIIEPMLSLPLSPIYLDRGSAGLWKLQNGYIVAKIGDGALCLYDSKDEELISIVERLDIDERSKVMAIGSRATGSTSDLEP